MGVDVTGNEAPSVVDKTWKKPAEGEDRWVVGVDGFHTLHCIVSGIPHIFSVPHGPTADSKPSQYMLYKGIHPEYYHLPKPSDTIHLDHCIDYLRQSAMCSVDITPVRMY